MVCFLGQVLATFLGGLNILLCFQNYGRHWPPLQPCVNSRWLSLGSRVCPLPAPSHPYPPYSQVLDQVNRFSCSPWWEWRVQAWGPPVNPLTFTVTTLAKFLLPFAAVHSEPTRPLWNRRSPSDLGLLGLICTLKRSKDTEWPSWDTGYSDLDPQAGKPSALGLPTTLHTKYPGRSSLPAWTSGFWQELDASSWEVEIFIREHSESNNRV